jgi:hypothetical protein
VSRPYNRYRHVTKAQQQAAAARIVVTLKDHTRCPKCGQFVADREIVNGVFPEHYVIGKIPCGWNEERAS